MAGEFTITTTETYNYAGVKVGGQTQTLTAEETINFSKTVPANSTDVEYALPVVLADVVSMSCDSSEDNVTVKTNNTGSPDDTLTIDKTNVLHWDTTKPSGTKFITSDIVSVFITTGSKSATVRFSAGLNVAA